MVSFRRILFFLPVKNGTVINGILQTGQISSLLNEIAPQLLHIFLVVIIYVPPFVD